MRLKRAVYELAFVFMSSTLLYTIEQQVLLLQGVPTSFEYVHFSKLPYIVTWGQVFILFHSLLFTIFEIFVKKMKTFSELYFLWHPVIARATGCHVLLSPLSVRICEIVWVIKSEKFLGLLFVNFHRFCLSWILWQNGMLFGLQLWTFVGWNDALFISCLSFVV